MRTALLLLLSVALTSPLTGCKKNDKGTDSPDAAAESDQDPLAELQAIPGQVQAEVDMVLQPITDVDVVIDQVAAMPSELGLDAASLKAMASTSLQAGMEDGEITVSADLELAAEARAEVEAVLAKIKGIVTGLRQTPERVQTATTHIVGLGTKATGLVTSLTATYQAKLANPLLKADAKAKLQADLDLVIKLDADIKATVSDAKATVGELPSKGKDALVKITAAFAGSGAASAEAG